MHHILAPQPPRLDGVRRRCADALVQFLGGSQDIAVGGVPRIPLKGHQALLGNLHYLGCPVRVEAGFDHSGSEELPDALRNTVRASARGRDKPTSHSRPPTRIRRDHRCGGSNTTQLATACRCAVVRDVLSQAGQGCGAPAHISSDHVIATSHAALSDCTATGLPEAYPVVQMEEAEAPPATGIHSRARGTFRGTRNAVVRTPATTLCV